MPRNDKNSWFIMFCKKRLEKWYVLCSSILRIIIMLQCHFKKQHLIVVINNHKTKKGSILRIMYMCNIIILHLSKLGIFKTIWKTHIHKICILLRVSNNDFLIISSKTPKWYRVLLPYNFYGNIIYSPILFSTRTKLNCSLIV